MIVTNIMQLEGVKEENRHLCEDLQEKEQRICELRGILSDIRQATEVLLGILKFHNSNIIELIVNRGFRIYLTMYRKTAMSQCHAATVVAS